MDYPYENLGPERFQLFCQALLAKDRPNMQCFPVAQPDGGRDAVQFLPDAYPAKEFAAFQVKYVRQPTAIVDPHKWLIEVAAGELPKIKKQIPAGAKAAMQNYLHNMVDRGYSARAWMPKLW